MHSRAAVMATLLVLALSAAGCGVTSVSTSGLGHPAGPTLEQFGLRERCLRGGDCSQQAEDAIEAALGRLGAAIENTPIASNAGAPPVDRLYVQASRDPPMEWRSESASGTSLEVMIDLTDENPYVVVAPGQAFRLTEGDAAAIRDALFIGR
jgi:hypothetical protein